LIFAFANAIIEFLASSREVPYRWHEYHRLESILSALKGTFVNANHAVNSFIGVKPLSWLAPCRPSSVSLWRQVSLSFLLQARVFSKEYK
jgi:hypothetical protein